ncbi:MAG: hypothetical protein DWQ47_17680 [Acidobacteria bacterium]|nr:MAG: hypothetical protein DWQ32_05080 [Acidobacteriota bacterium]REK02131.1 MAG: hypothetical protein DWQ38_07075 [Acidobacteriota bacterium]REK14067.1 MAG: hypothetical protein DWQ43_10770 [Acidobacteriota bacterium]REK42062.1 MAG: hypothetical protein DWQ47_17680 [Acidobacteriota bacterium]
MLATTTAHDKRVAPSANRIRYTNILASLKSDSQSGFSRKIFANNLSLDLVDFPIGKSHEDNLTCFGTQKKPRGSPSLLQRDLQFRYSKATSLSNMTNETTSAMKGTPNNKVKRRIPKFIKRGSSISSDALEKAKFVQVVASPESTSDATNGNGKDKQNDNSILTMPLMSSFERATRTQHCALGLYGANIYPSLPGLDQIQ